MSDSATIILWVSLTFVAAGLIKGVVGMGLPTVAMGVLSLVMLQPEMFRRWFFIGPIVLGAYMFVREARVVDQLLPPASAHASTRVT